jgi:hypothetical protein
MPECFLRLSPALSVNACNTGNNWVVVEDLRDTPPTFFPLFFNSFTNKFVFDGQF